MERSAQKIFFGGNLRFKSRHKFRKFPRHRSFPTTSNENEFSKFTFTSDDCGVIPCVTPLSWFIYIVNSVFVKLFYASGRFHFSGSATDVRTSRFPESLRFLASLEASRLRRDEKSVYGCFWENPERITCVLAFLMRIKKENFSYERIIFTWEENLHRKEKSPHERKILYVEGKSSYRKNLKIKAKIRVLWLLSGQPSGKRMAPAAERWKLGKIVEPWDWRQLSRKFVRTDLETCIQPSWRQTVALTFLL